MRVAQSQITMMLDDLVWLLSNISEWRVKVSGNQSTVRISRVRLPRALEDAWGRKLWGRYP